jgi:hypothetical protein
VKSSVVKFTFTSKDRNGHPFERRIVLLGPQTCSLLFALNLDPVLGRISVIFSDSYVASQIPTHILLSIGKDYRTTSCSSQ